MKISIPNGIIKTAIRKGGVAAFTSEAKDEDAKSKRPTLDCVKIQTDGKTIVFESSVSQIDSRFTLPVDSSITVDSPGAVCASAEWLLRNCCESLKDNYKVVIETNPVEKTVVPAEGEILPTAKIHINAIGTDGKRLSKWSSSAYDSKVFPETSYAEGSLLFSCKASVLQAIVENVLFSANLSDYLELLDNVAIFRSGGKLMFATTDGKRCTVKTADPSSVNIGKGTGRTLVKANLLSKAVSVFDEGEEVSVFDAGDGQNVILKSGSVEFKIAMPPPNLRGKFPDVPSILGMPMDFSVEIQKDILIERLNIAALSNPMSGKYTVKLGETEMTIFSSNSGTDETNEVFVPTSSIPKSLSKEHISLSTVFFQDITKRLAGGKIKVSFTPDERRIKVEDPEDPSYVYLMQKMVD